MSPDRLRSPQLNSPTSTNQQNSLLNNKILFPKKIKRYTFRETEKHSQDHNIFVISTPRDLKIIVC
jgi:hypothetical protein